LSKTTKFSLWVQPVLPLLHRTCSVTREAFVLLQVIHPAAVSYELQQLIHTAAGSFWFTASDTHNSRFI